MTTVHSHIDQKSIYRKNPDIVCRTILDETILVPICGRLADMQNIYALDQVSAFIWNHIDGSASLKTIHSRIQNEFMVDVDQAQEDLVEFIDELVKADLIVLSRD